MVARMRRNLRIINADIFVKHVKLLATLRFLSRSGTAKSELTRNLEDEVTGKRIRASAALLPLMAATMCIGLPCVTQASEAATAAPAAKAACTLPTTMAATDEETAWQILIAASCKSNGQLGWENWTEQTCWLNPGSPGCGAAAAASSGVRVRHLHGSQLGQRLRPPTVKPNLAGTTPGGCSDMTTASNASPQLKPFVPGNLATNAQFCEEVFADTTEAAFITAPAAGATLVNLAGQAAYIATGKTITVPDSGIELKADWLPEKALNPEFNCTDKRPAGVYLETIDNVCYALVGIHLSSKLLPDWLWATFEPQNKETNPNRCNPKLYNGCEDRWGSRPAASKGEATQAAAALKALITAAGLPKEFLNYRLVATETAYVNAANHANHLGNSFVEFNAGVPPHQASCVTCHSYAQVSTGGVENSLGTSSPKIGTPGALAPPAGGGSWNTQDFSWLLGSMPSTAEAAAAAKKKK